MQIDPDQYYPPTADELRFLGAVQTLARWRHEGRGPAWVRSGNKVLYKGSDILNWLEASRIEPRRHREEAEGAVQCTVASEQWHTPRTRNNSSALEMTATPSRRGRRSGLTDGSCERTEARTEKAE